MKHTSWQPPDLDEIRPNQFVINNEKVRPMLRGDGRREGVFFYLENWRKAGWVARIRAAGFNVRTLQDRVDRLPTIQSDQHLGPQATRTLTSARERIAVWDAQSLRWRELEPVTEDGAQVVRLRVNQPVRRRKSRGSGDYFITLLDRTGAINLRPVSETDALLHAYALQASSEHPTTLHITQTSQSYFLSNDAALLPAPHRETLDLLAHADAPQWTFEQDQMPLVQAILNKLGVSL